MGRRNTSVTKALLAFAASGLLVLLLVGTASVLVLHDQNDVPVTAAVDDARTRAEEAAARIGKALPDSIADRGKHGLPAPPREATSGLLKRLVANVHDPIERVRIWDPRLGGLLVIAYPPADCDAAPPSSTPAPIATHNPGGIATNKPQLSCSPGTMSPTATDAHERGEALSVWSDGSTYQPGLRTGLGQLLEVDVPVNTSGPEHHDLLLEALVKPVAVQASNLELWSAVMPVLAVALVAIAVLLFPLAYRLARKVREAQGERVLLLQRAIDASDLERLRITSDLHDGLVQEFAGLAMSLSATAETVSERDPQTGDALNEASDMVRQGMRSLRSAVMAIYPPTLHSAGLPAALSDLAAPLEAQGIRVRLDVDESLDLPATIEPLLFRCAQESVRNIINHARASEVSISLSASRRSIVLQIVDDGSGFSAAERELAHADGHAGLRLMEDLAKDAGASLVVASEPGRGTTVRLEAPR